MKWRRGYRSKHVEDRRGRRGRKRVAASGVGGLLILLVGAYLGVDVSSLVGSSTRHASKGGAIPASRDSERQVVEFVSFVHDDIQGDWKKRMGRTYRPATLVLYRQGTQSGCGYGTSAIGPFYCAADKKVYVDLSFFRTLHRRFGAPGDFAQAYVLAHEIGHHIQNLRGTSARVRRAKKKLSKRAANRESVKLELQADCFAGVWAHGAKGRDLLDPGDIEEGLAAAAAIGDDALQKMSGKRVQPERWTHGSSSQRMKWFRRGLATGEVDQCDTFD